jgi:hypothetical protein
MKLPSLLALLALSIAIAPAQTPPALPAVTSLNDAFAQGKFSLNARLRWESADQSNLKDANALTLGTRFGFTSASFNGFQGMLEGDNVVSLGDTDDYNAAGTNPGGAGRTVIGDPSATGINQAWLSYSAADTVIKAGRQHIRLDNMRFVGDSAWRQNMQTYDAATVTYRPDQSVNFYYGYVWRVSRPFGNQAPQRDFTGDSHFINASYTGLPYGKLTAYAYLLDFDNSAANSSNSFGASFAGSAPVTSDFKLTYRAEYATQENAGKNPLSYRADYYVLELGGALKPFAFGAGYEVLGSDDGKKGFSTPIAGLHPFNGWADMFGATPANGLRDLYFNASVALPGGFPVKLAYHDYESDRGGVDYGSEWDAMVSHKIGKNWGLFAEAAHYEGRAPYFDTDKFWLWVQFDY